MPSQEASMQAKQIKVGGWYETTQGLGRCVEVEQGVMRGGALVRVDIRLPFRRGVVNLTPRDVVREVAPPPP
jgi:hypothetical protein